MTNVQINSQGKVYMANGQALLSTKNIQSLNVTPSTSAQLISVPSGVDGYNPVAVLGVTASIDSNITAENIKKDVTILGVTGTLEGSGGGASNGDFYVMIAPSGSNYNKLTSFVINGVDYKQNIFDAFDVGSLPGGIKHYKISLPLGSSYNYSFTCSSGYAPISGSTSGTIDFTNKVSQLYQIILEEEY
jgi:hypothetical protein